jgi:putative heme transporter
VAHGEPLEPAATRPRRRRWATRRNGLGLAGLLLIVATFAFALPKIADYRDVWAVVKSISWPWIAALGAATVLNIITFAPPWMVLLPRLRFRSALAMSQAATALSIVVPGGAAVGIAGAYGMLRSWGFKAQEVGRAVTLVSLWNQFANLAYPIVAVFLLSASGGQSPALVTAAFVGVAVLGVAVTGLILVLASHGMAGGIGDLAASTATWMFGKVGRGPVSWGGESFERFRLEAVDVLRRRWHLLTLATFAGSLTVFLVFIVSLRAVGVTASEISAVEAFAAWSLARLLGTIPITPGGVGVVELGLTGALVGFGGANAEVVAAVLVYRFLTMVPTILLGLLAAATFRRHAPRAAEA